MNVSSFTRPLCKAVARHIRTVREIGRRTDQYLTRYYPFGKRGRSTKKHNEYVHQFHRSDWDLELHNHPWRWGISIILAGGYDEERMSLPTAEPPRGGDRFPLPLPPIVRRRLRPFSINIIRDTDFHRVDLLEKDCWTFFIAGPENKHWGFIDRDTGLFRVAEPDGDVPEHVASGYEKAS